MVTALTLLYIRLTMKNLVGRDLEHYNKFTIIIVYELDIINAISVADIAFSSHVKFKVCLATKSLELSLETEWLNASPLFLRMRMYNKAITEFGFRMISWVIKTSCRYYLPEPSASADNTDLGFDNLWYYAQPHSIIVRYPGILSISNIYDTRIYNCADSYSFFISYLSRYRPRLYEWQEKNLKLPL